jgi:ABC-type Fe3+/spermidine/putrescine transport system ATPase subunit
LRAVRDLPIQQAGLVISITMSNANFVQLKHLHKRFGDIRAVDDVNLAVAEGTLVCLLGPSGCGKTTTLRMIGGFEEPSSGEILIGDEEITRLPPYSRPTAMVFQNYALFPHMSVADNVAYGLRARKVPKQETQERVAEAIALMELTGQEHKAPPQLSGGQQQRVALARALVIRPKVLLFDEPLSNLDARLRVRMRTEIRQIQQRLGITSIYVTHDQEEAFSLADQVAIMNHGRIAQLGTPYELYHTPADQFVAEFVGLSNIVPVQVVESGARGTMVQCLGRTLPAHQHTSPGVPAVDPLASGKKEMVAVLRPEALKIHNGADASAMKASVAGAADTIAARVQDFAFLGSLVRYTVVVEENDVPPIELTVDLHNPHPEQFYAPGSLVHVQLPKEGAALLH